MRVFAGAVGSAVTRSGAGWVSGDLIHPAADAAMLAEKLAGGGAVLSRV
jgi:hypothetical protein